MNGRRISWLLVAVSPIASAAIALAADKQGGVGADPGGAARGGELAVGAGISMVCFRGYSGSC